MIFFEDIRLVFQKFCKLLPAKSETIIVVLCAISILLAMTTPRFHLLIDKIVVQTFLQYFQFTVAVCAASLVLVNHPKYFLLAASALSLVILQSFSFLYWPSMNWDTPIQDYYLMDEVSSNYSFDQGMRYLHNFTIFLFPAWALWLFSKKNENRIHIYLLTVLAIALLVNSGVAIYQWQMDIHFLAQGSGSAVHAARATGLLEDSGASTVFFAAMLSGVAYLLFVGTCRWPLKILWFFILAFGFLGGVASKGRIFFISLGLSLLLLLVLQIFKAIRTRSPVVILASILVFSSMVLIWEFAENRYPYAVQTIKHFQSIPEILNHETPFNELMLRVDPARGVLMKVMIKAFSEHPVFGTGYGSFYMNFFEHRQWAEKGTWRTGADPPASLYLMLLSEFGIAGGLLILLKLLVLAKGSWKLAHSSSTKTEKTNHTLLQSFAIGALTSLAFSFLIGLHLLFQSISAIFALSLFFAVDGDGKDGKKKKPFHVLIYSIAGFSILLTFSVVLQWWTAPPSPEFRWRERGKPQIPLNLNLPIQTPEKGTWLVSGAEVAITHPIPKIFVEPPQEYYPHTVKLVVRNSQRQILHEQEIVIEKYELPNPGKIIEVEFDVTLCLPATLSNYCSIQVKTIPTWRMYGHKVGYYLF